MIVSTLPANAWRCLASVASVDIESPALEGCGVAVAEMLAQWAEPRMAKVVWGSHAGGADDRRWIVVRDEVQLEAVLEVRLHPCEHCAESRGRADRFPDDSVRVAVEAGVLHPDECPISSKGLEDPLDGRWLIGAAPLV